ncbi:peroxidase [Mycobacterium paraintracellulare]|uniref:alpha/beta fold hydrolase n=1 Tax=Mycobacterium avium complex (MAC) TaxID=120793 RepID=UPI001935C30D|nr:alpha/beta hydrolase [Mycobacterium avium]BCO39248.1 peroxidase [Mycobacterium paraintracellulare]
MAGHVISRRVDLPAAGVMLAADLWEPATHPRGTVVLMHGGGQTRHSWNRTGERLVRHGFRALSVDARGHGESQWAPDGDYSTDVMVADLLAIVGRLDQRPVLVGASMGGVTSLVALGEHGPFARGLVLVDVVANMRPEGVQRVRDFMLGAPDGFDSLEEVAAAVRSYTPHRRRAVDLDGLRKNVRRRQNGRWYWHWDPAWGGPDGMPDIDALRRRMEAAARSVHVPTLVVRGLRSDVTDDTGVRELVDMIPDARTIGVADAGHMLAGDDNDVFTATLQAFLDDLPADPP